MLTCEFCDASFKNKQSLSKHFNSFHKLSPPKSTIAFVDEPEIPAGHQSRKDASSDDSSGTDQQTRFKSYPRLLDTTTEASSGASSETDISVDSDGEPNPFRLKGDKGSKRKHKSDSSDDEQPAKLSKLEPKKKHFTKRAKDTRFNYKYNNKRVHVFDTEDDELEKKRYRTSDKDYTFKNKLQTLKGKNRYLENLKHHLNVKISGQTAEIRQLQRSLQKEVEQKQLLAEQLGDVKKRDFDGVTAVEKALMNSVTIEQINEIRQLISLGYIEPLLEDENKLIVIQRIMTGMLEGVIPISNPQDMAFTKKQREFMHRLESVGIDDVKHTIIENVQEFYDIFEILDISLKMITKAFNKYGEN